MVYLVILFIDNYKIESERKIDEKKTESQINYVFEYNIMKTDLVSLYRYDKKKRTEELIDKCKYAYIIFTYQNLSNCLKCEKREN